MSIFRKLFGSKKEDADQQENMPDQEEAKVVQEDMPDEQEDSDGRIPFDFEGMLKKQLMRNESTYRYQPIVIRRSTEENRLTLGEILHELGLMKKEDYNSLLVLVRNVYSNEVETNRVDDKDEIYNFDIFACFQKNKQEGFYTEGRTYDSTLVLSGKTRNLYINIIALGGPRTMMYFRVSVCSPDNSKQDDMRSSRFYRSKNMPDVTSFVVTFAQDGYEEELAYYESVVKIADQKEEAHEKHDEIEEEYFHGKFEFKGYPYIGYAKWLFEQSRYFDTYEMMTRAYNFMRHSIHHADKDVQDIFYEVCLYMAKSLFEMGRFEEAMYYCDIATKYAHTYEPFLLRAEILAEAGDATAIYAANDVIKQTNAQDKGEASGNSQHESRFIQMIAAKLGIYKRAYDHQINKVQTVNGIITIGELLKMLMGIYRFNILPTMVIIDNINNDIDNIIVGGENVVDGGNDIESYVLNVESCQDKTFVLGLTHSHTQEHNSDQSILCFHATLIITTHRVNQSDGNNLMRVDIMRANFNNNDDKYEPDSAINMPLNSSVILGVVPEGTFGASKEDCIQCYLYGRKIVSQYRFVEAGKYFKWAFENARNLMKGDNGMYDIKDQEVVDLFFESAMGFGYSLMEIENFTKAQYYLNIAKDSKNMDALVEYINCLSNSKSPIALRVIEDAAHALPDPETDEQREIWENYMAFLNRRKAFVLIDLHEYREARSFLRELLKDSKSKDFAMNELNYLNTIERREIALQQEAEENSNS